MSAWDAVRECITRGEDVTLDTIARACAEGPLPDDLAGKCVTIHATPARRGPKRKWSDEDLRVIKNIIARVNFLSEVLTARDGYCWPLPKYEVYERVGSILRHPVKGKALAALFRRYPLPPQRGVRIVTDEQIRSVLHPVLVKQKLGLEGDEPIFPPIRMSIIIPPEI